MIVRIKEVCKVRVSGANFVVLLAVSCYLMKFANGSFLDLGTFQNADLTIVKKMLNIVQ